MIERHFPASLEIHVEKGALFDVSDRAARIGINDPVAIAVGAWRHCIMLPPSMTFLQNQTTRLDNVLWRFRLAPGDEPGRHLKFKAMVQNWPTSEPTAVDLIACRTVFETGPSAIEITLAEEWDEFSVF